MLRCPGSHHMTMRVPEIFFCPRCGQECEIWRDEGQGRCLACRETISQRDALAHRLQDSRKRAARLEGDVVMAVCESPDITGRILYFERYESVVPVSSMEHHSRFKEACSACHCYGKNLGCPPFSPAFELHTQKMETARVLCLRLPLEYFEGEHPQEAHRLCFEQVQALLTKELMEARNQGYTVAGAGPCRGCKTCTAAGGKTRCHRPEARIFSLESLGVNLVSLARKCFRVNLQWSRDGDTALFVSALGAIFFRGDAA